MAVRKKSDFPVSEIRRFIEPGPIVLVSSQHKGERNIMTMGWHMVMSFEPSLIGCYVWNQNHSHELIRKSRQCVINVPTSTMADTVVGIGNTSGRDIDKFQHFNLTATKAENVDVPMIGECHANLECRLVDGTLIRTYSVFVFEVVKAHAPKTPRTPKMLHYTGDGVFITSGPTRNLRKKFRPEKL